MVKKIEIEVFRDNDYPDIDSDEIAHSLEAIEVLKPYIRILNRNRGYNLSSDSHPAGVLDTRRMLLAHNTDFAVLGTGRRIIDSDDDSSLGIYLPDMRLAIVGIESPDVAETSQHEVGHIVYDPPAYFSETADKLDHCELPTCIMYPRPVFANTLTVPSIASRKVARGMSRTAIAKDSQAYITQIFCEDCLDALEQSAELKYRILNNLDVPDYFLSD